MFGIPKKNKKNITKKADMILLSIKESVFRPTKAFLTKIRFNARKRLVNRWARKNPKAFMLSYLGIALVFVALNCLDIVFGFTTNSNDSNLLGEEELSVVSNRIKQSEIIESNRKMLFSEYNRFAELSNQRILELDSLMKLSEKSHTDSVRIVQLYTALEKTLN